MQPPDPVAITLRVVHAFEALGIPYLIGGSLASIMHGIVRTTMDSDLVADIKRHQARPFAQAVEDEFWVEVESIVSALQHRSSFALIHKESTFKVDVFIYQGRPFDRE
ncbi:MAG: hypothetical protein M3220_16670 [Chloroflexota bacterium]|nr:hypothetical protein [Chloroflexota bacterium]